MVHSRVDVQELGCDFYVFTGHKLYGPTGAGILWGRYDILKQMPPYQGGGDMIETVSFDKTTYKAPPARFEAGTPAIMEVIGLGAAIDYVSAIGMDAIAAHEKALLDYAMGQLATIDGLTYYGSAQQKAGIISFAGGLGACIGYCDDFGPMRRGGAHRASLLYAADEAFWRGGHSPCVIRAIYE